MLVKPVWRLTDRGSLSGGYFNDRTSPASASDNPDPPQLQPLLSYSLTVFVGVITLWLLYAGFGKSGPLSGERNIRGRHHVRTTQRWA